jgi:hypothetical protein
MMILNQKLREGKWDNWLEKIQEYDIDIKTLKLSKEKVYVSSSRMDIRSME